MKNQTEQAARKWVDMVVKERGIKQTVQIMQYNTSGKNPHFKESNLWVTAAFQRLNELNPS